MPFGSYEASSVAALENAIKLTKYGNAQAVKLEGGRRMAERVKAITDAGNYNCLSQLGTIYIIADYVTLRDPGDGTYRFDSSIGIGSWRIQSSGHHT